MGLAMVTGEKIGPYTIVGKLGEGGMGAVFRARDTKLERDVAIKVLPEAFAHDADRLARFTREARTLASLNHPHIAAIYGLEESKGITALVMELVEGDDLSQRIAHWLGCWLFLPIRGVERSFFVAALVGVGAEEVALGLDEVGGQAFGAEGVEICECR